MINPLHYRAMLTDIYLVAGFIFNEAAFAVGFFRRRDGPRLRVARRRVIRRD